MGNKQVSTKVLLRDQTKIGNLDVTIFYEQSRYIVYGRLHIKNIFGTKKYNFLPQKEYTVSMLEGKLKKYNTYERNNIVKFIERMENKYSKISV